jgi:hypothetical protein
MEKDNDYILMKKMIDNMRNPILTEEILNDKSAQLQQHVMDANNEDQSITLDNNKVAKIITDANVEVSDRITTGAQQVLNEFMMAVQGTVTDIELMTVHIGDTSLVITIKVVLKDGQPATIHIDSQSQHIQLKYDNFLALDDENVKFITAAHNYFNPKLMGYLQSAVTTNIQ